MSSNLRRFTPIALMIAALVFLAQASAHAAPQSDASDRCGALEIGSTAPSSTDETQSRFKCFTAAMTACDPVVLSVSAHTADAIVTRTFSTEMGERGCTIVETIERSRGNNSTTDSNMCTAVARTKDGLAFSRCGTDGDVFIPEVPTAEAAAAFVKPRS